MAASNTPRLGYPCMAKVDDASIAIAGLSFTTSKNATSYSIQSFTLPVSDRLTNTTTLTFTPIAAEKTNVATPLPGSRMECSFDPKSGTFVYIFNENVYFDSKDAALSKTDPFSTWDAVRNMAPQALWPDTTIAGQFQWLGLSNNAWTTFTLDPTNGISPAAAAVVPSTIPTSGVLSLTREAGDSFLAIYNNQNSTETTAARFKLGDTVATPVKFTSADVGNIHFASISSAEDETGDYFFGSDSSARITFTVKTNATTNLQKLSTRTFPSDDNGRVPQIYDYGAATMIASNFALVYGGQSNITSNTWSFGMTTVDTDAGISYNSYSIFAESKSQPATGSFFVATPQPPAAPEEKGLSTPAIVGIAVGAVALLLIIGLFIAFQRRNKKLKERVRDQEGLDMAVRDLHAKGAEGMGYRPPSSTHSLLASDTPRTRHAASPRPEPENLTLRVPIVRYDGRDVAQSVPHANLGAVVLSQYRLGQTAVNTKMVVIQLGENVDTAESVTLKWVRDEIVWQREAAMLNHIVNPAKIISLHQTMIIPAALEWRHILVLDAHETTLDFELSQHQHRILDRPVQMSVAKALLSGLVWCHEKDVIHLSICTGSMVMNEEGNWVLWSFGGARFLNEAVGPRQGSLIGQENGSMERNLAPELLTARRDRRLDTTLATPAMDAWAAGCVLFEVLTGQGLFRTEEAAEQAATGKFNAWKERMNDIKDANEKKVVEGLLVLDPNYRMSLSQAASQFV
ncbi:hypothetical protein BGZ76_004310 [Entomortierella beljakovae]|nr:hypothetical protein BGZ76_004310 [Entomortierella beljakovae]